MAGTKIKEPSKTRAHIEWDDSRGLRNIRHTSKKIRWLQLIASGPEPPTRDQQL
jgi:hypothetical protein